MTNATNGLPNHLPDDLRAIYDRYIDHTMRGCTFYQAALRVGVAAENASRWVCIAEDDKYVIAKRALLMGQFRPHKAWTPAEATLSLLRIANDELEKGTTRVAAMKELNVLMGYVTLPDDPGKTRSAGTLTLEEVLRMAKAKRDEGAGASESVH
jgi:hypothetical protein